MMKIQSKGIANKSTKGEILDVFFSYIEFEDKQIINNIPDLKNSYQEIIEINWSHKDLDREIESELDDLVSVNNSEKFNERDSPISFSNNITQCNSESS